MDDFMETPVRCDDCGDGEITFWDLIAGPCGNGTRSILGEGPTVRLMFFLSLWLQKVHGMYGGTTPHG